MLVALVYREILQQLNLSCKMRIQTTVVALGALGALSTAKETAVDMKLKAELFDSGVRHAQIMAIKNVSL